MVPTVPDPETLQELIAEFQSDLEYCLERYDTLQKELKPFFEEQIQLDIERYCEDYGLDPSGFLEYARNYFYGK